MMVLDAPGSALDIRQILAMGTTGRNAIFTGAGCVRETAEARGPNCIAAGNMPIHEGVAQAMVDAYTTAAAERLDVDGVAQIAQRLIAQQRTVEVGARAHKRAPSRVTGTRTPTSAAIASVPGSSRR